MAAFHARSNSLPSRPHPLISQFNEQVSRIRDSQATSTSSSSSICHKLSGLQDLHDCIDKLLQLPLTHQSLAEKKCVDEVLNGPLGLLDLCNIIRDALSQTKECVHELQSAISRRQEGLDSEIRKYLSSRKAVAKAIKKALKNLNKCTSSSSINDEPEIITMLRELEAITISVFESLLSFVSEPQTQSRTGRWSLVSKLMQNRRVAACQEDEMSINEFAAADSSLEGLLGCKTSKSDSYVSVDNVQKKLNSLEVCVQELENGTECLFREMIKTRVTFLNVFN